MTAQDALFRARERARQGVDRLRDALGREFFSRDDIIIGVNGSYARGEVTTGSDVDVFVLGISGGEEYQPDRERVIEIITSLGLKPPASDGVFARSLCLTDLIKNIGGKEDTNESITRRMLFLLEGEWLLNEQAFRTARKRMIRAYVKDDIATGKVCRYLLSDIIRYWRTVCVDYEYKQAHGKPPGIRRIKLRFSRCLMYFAGVLAVGETVGRDAEGKRDHLEQSFATPALERTRQILGDRSERIVALYAKFLDALDSDSVRHRLEASDYESSAEYRMLRGLAREFRNELVAQLRERYGPEHDIMYGLLI
ncbi:MAG TPA: nucleotidyltransferase domain-containing protein [Steroidobacteraceae bacterium]|nr:nucleotidyltransferase domain-containing protein [Steroidobacteraceae bacterium]